MLPLQQIVEEDMLPTEWKIDLINGVESLQILQSTRRKLLKSGDQTSTRIELLLEKGIFEQLLEILDCCSISEDQVRYSGT